MDSTNGIYDNHLYQTIWKAPNKENSDDVNNKDILRFVRKPSGNVSSDANKSESEKKPPTLPNRTSVVINLDKNRIRVGRRSRLLPRPLSLPSSFNLLKNFKQNTESSAREASLDISLIKKLEDEIYQRKEDMLRQNENVINKKICDNVKCTNCSKIHSFVPNQIVETKTFLDDTSAFTDPESKPVLVVDSSKLQPLLMKRDKDSEVRSISGAKSILIVDNSQFYPVLMTYEIKNKTENDCQQKVEQKLQNVQLAKPPEIKNKKDNDIHKKVTQRLQNVQSSKPPTVSTKIVNKTSEPSKHSRNITHLFESCFCKSNPPSPILSPPNTNYPSSTRSTISTSSSSSLCSNVINDDKNMSSRKSSKFKRFLIHRRSLNLPSKTQRTDEIEMTGTKVKDKKKFIGADIPNMYMTKNKCVPDFQLDDVHFTNFECKLKNNKLKWLLSIIRKTSNTSLTKYSSAKKRWLSCDDVNSSESHKCNNYLSIYCEAFKNINWSYEDVNDIRNNFNCITESKQCDTHLNNVRNEDINKITTPAECNSNNLVRRVRRRSSFRNKRHSVGSTDVVKTWVYRKR